MSVNEFDPWVSCNNGQNMPTISPFQGNDEIKSPEQYIASLEAKLKKLRGNAEPTSRAMLGEIMKTRESHMDLFMQQGYSNIAEDYSMNTENDGNETRLQALQRRLQPEKQALSPEELQALVCFDQLQKAKEEDLDKQNEEQTRATEPQKDSKESSSEATSAENKEKTSQEKKDKVVCSPQDKETNSQDNKDKETTAKVSKCTESNDPP